MIYEYNLTDSRLPRSSHSPSGCKHTGSTRITFGDADADGLAEILQENQYSPFGMAMTMSSTLAAAPPNNYLYNGKELQDELDLGWYDYGARMYDASIGRWNGVDALAEERNWLTSYNYVQNNPMLRIDPTGNLDGHYVDEAGNYVGQDANTNDNTVYVTSQDNWDDAGGQECAQTKGGTSFLQSEGNSTRLDQYGEGINITDETWDDIEESGGEKLEPFVENNSDETVYYKPEGVEDGIDHNPGYDQRQSYPISPNSDLYVPVDGVNTSQVENGNVYRVPTGFAITIDETGDPSSWAGWLPNYGETTRTGAEWQPLVESIPRN